jgi:hypothetical protein
VRVGLRIGAEFGAAIGGTAERKAMIQIDLIVRYA